MFDPRFLFAVSRPRFWLYILGPYMVGLAAGALTVAEMTSLTAIIFGIFFLFPANLLIYGVNDVYDFETDRVNPKKQDYEMLVQPAMHRPLMLTIAALNIPFVVAAYFLVPQALPSLLGFIFFSVFYSSPPIRAKAIPILDSIFNVLYVFPGAFAYQLLTGSFPPFMMFAAAALWTMAMHAYSAIPDIESDLKAGLATSATALGHHRALVACAVLWAGAAGMVTALRVLWPWCLLAWCYPVAPLVLLLRPPRDVARAYWYFPWVNAGLGMLAFFLLAGPRL